nr:F-box protein At1g78280 [Tanacetum cinerariifolium]
SEVTRNEKRVKIDEHMEDASGETATNGGSKCFNKSDLEFSYDIDFLTMFLDKDRDHYNSLWSTSNCIGQREMRDWLWKLWIGKPGIRDLIWKGACIALNTNKWSTCMEELCAFHNFPLPADEEKFPVGTGSNPVYLVGDNVVKIFVEDGLEASLYALGAE